MKKINSFMIAAALAVTASAGGLPVRAAESVQDSSYSTNGESVCFYSSAAASTDFIVNTIAPFKGERTDEGYVFTPGNLGTSIVSVCVTREQIVNYELYGGSTNHFHYFYPCITSYRVNSTADGVEVRCEGIADYSQYTDFDSLAEEYSAKAQEQQITAEACFDFAPCTVNEALGRQYYSYLNTALRGAPYFRFTDYEYGQDTSRFIMVTNPLDDALTVSAELETTEITSSGSCADAHLDWGTDDELYYYSIAPANDGVGTVTDNTTGTYSGYSITVQDGEFVLPYRDMSHIMGEAPEGLVDVYEVEPGDLNYDGLVSVADCVRLSRYLLGAERLTAQQLYAGDVNSDNSVDTFDLVMLRRLVSEPRAGVYLPVWWGYCTDTTYAVTAKGFRSAASDTSYVIESASQLDEVITPLFRPAVVRSLEKAYVEEFFAEKVLLLKLESQGMNDDWEPRITSVSYNENGTEVQWEKAYINGYANAGVYIHQIIVPKGMFRSSNVTWSESGAEHIDCVRTVDMADFFVTDYARIDSETVPERFVTSAEELTAFLELYMAGDVLAEYQERYNEEFFKSSTLYLRFCNDFNSMEEPYRATKKDGVITVDGAAYPAYGCVICDYLEQYVFSREDTEGAQVKLCRHLAISEYESPSGTSGIFVSPDERYAVRLVQYSFLNENAVGIYRAEPLALMPFGASVRLDDIPVDEGVELFPNSTNDVIAPDSGDNYAIEWNGSTVTVKIRTSEGGDFVTREYDCTEW